MVLQQGKSVPVWGWGDEGSTVTVQIQGQTASSVVKDGKWMVHLHDLKPGGPDKLVVTGHGRVEFKNVLVGEVWLAGGQSNMEFPLKRSFEASNDVAAAGNSMIRLIKVPHVRLDAPTNDISASWSAASPETAGNISAVGYYCARELQAKLHVPVGLIESDWGGTPAEAWMDESFLRSKPDYEIGVIMAGSLSEQKYELSLAQYEKEKQAAADSNTEFKKRPPGKPWRPGELYNGMIAPLAPYAIRGALWYQGEANAGNLDQAFEYHKLFPDLIRDWRMRWDEGEFPFLLVQLAPFQNITNAPQASAWASVREAQLQSAEKLHNVGMAVITDVGEEHDIHPTKKQPGGHRLALAAEAIAYHEPIEYSGPVFKSMKTKGYNAILSFDHLGGGLVAKGGELIGFSIAGPDHKFVWAIAEIRGDKVVAHSRFISDPVAVRYGWANYPVVNLWNKAGLPASPFRTDDFER